jgi:hypothetical protein
MQIGGSRKGVFSVKHKPLNATIFLHFVPPRA